MRAVAACLPTAPGVYRFRDASGRSLYLGRAVNLRRRVRSYWSDLGGRQHLAPMVARVAAVEAVACASEHEAAWLERSLLERQLPPWNRTPGGQEVPVGIRLDTSARSPGLAVLHLDGNGVGLLSARPGAQMFGPYLGGSRVRLAVAGLHRVFPVSYASDRQAGALGDLARRRGISPADRTAFVGSLTAVLERDPEAVADLRARLTERRDAAAAAEAYELAGRIQAELIAVDWITCEQRAAALGNEDADLAGWADGVLVRFDIRGGRICGWRQFSRTASQARRWIAGTPPAWRDFAAQNARLAACLRQAAGQPVSL